MSHPLGVTARRFTLAALPCLPILVWSARAALAQDESPGDNTLPSVVVSATRLPTPENQVASSVTVITSDEIEQKQERTLTDVLQDVPGLSVVQTGGPGGLTQVFIRGTGANEIKVLIDGIDVTDPSSLGNSFDFAHVLTSDIDRVEVLRGPQSGLYGADAIGGVINIITKAGSGPPQFRASIEGGSYDTLNETAGASGSVRRLSYAVDLGHFYVGATPVTPSDIVPPGFPVNKDSYDNKSASTKLGVKLTDNFDVGVVARYVDYALDTTNTPPEPLPDESDTRQLFTRATAHLVLFDGRLDQTVGIGYTDYHNDFVDPNAALAFPPNPYDFSGDRLKFDWQGNIKVRESQILTLGAEHEIDRTAASLVTPPQFAAEVTSDAGYMQLQSSFGERLFNTVSLRYDGNAEFGGKATYRLAPAYLIPETGTKLKATVGTGYNPPSLVELYENFPAFAFFGNPSLVPETSLGYDLGVEQAALDQRVKFGATWFHNDIRNLISANATTYVNIGQATTRGVESFVSYKPWDAVTLRADYTYTIAQDDIMHLELVRRPRDKASLNATWQVTNAASLAATVLYVGPWIDNSRDGLTTNIPVNGYMIVNLAGSYDLGHGVTAFARLNNMLDRHYQDPLGFERQGIGAFAGIRVALNPADQGR